MRIFWQHALQMQRWAPSRIIFNISGNNKLACCVLLTKQRNVIVFLYLRSGMKSVAAVQVTEAVLECLTWSFSTSAFLVDEYVVMLQHILNIVFFLFLCVQVKLWRLCDPEMEQPNSPEVTLQQGQDRLELVQFHPTASGLLAVGSAKTALIWDTSRQDTPLAGSYS